jgi:TonB-linked SusC/RagA family outer membrane protein
LTSLSAYAQSLVSGKVTSGTDQSPLPGVTIIVKGTSTGAISDADGKYSINAPENAVLIFRFTSYELKEVPVNSRKIINATLQKNVTGLNEVVVVGYGTQKKVNLTGSVATVNAEELTKRPLSNAVDLLQGKVPGLQVTQAYGKPGDAGNVMNIRGTGTFSSAGNNPLVLIDGIAGDMSNLDPNDIESISVLKDAASSAIYGARAANGVILVTTKKGKAGALTIEYNGNVQFQQATRLPKLLYNSADYMMYWNQGRIRNGLLPYFTETEIDSFRNSTNRAKYPNYDWIKEMFHTAVVQDHHLSVSGGNEKTTFTLGLSYLDQGGVVSVYDFKKYNAHLSVDSKVKDWISIGGTADMVRKDITENYINSNNGDYMLGVFGAGPNYTPTMTLPDGTTGYVARYSSNIGEWTVRNPVAANVAGAYNQNLYNISTQFYVNIKLTDNLTWYSKAAATLDDYFSKLHESAVNNYYFKDSSYAHNNAPVHLGVTDNSSQSLLTTVYSTLNYHKVINDIHTVNVLVGYNQESNYYRQLGGARITFPTTSIAELNAGSALGQTNSGTANAWGIQSFFGRANYNFKNKYLFEADARYDGTSRISPNNRWGFFPSVSAAWRLSEESFMKKHQWLTNLKLRGSWGQLGNQNVGLYPYQDILSTTSYPFDVLDPGVQLTRLVDKSLQWETTTMTDVGIDIDIKNGLFTATADWYNKLTDGILYQIPIPASVGLSAPTVNYGKMRNRGWELELGHRHQIGDFKYGISVNFSTNKNDVVSVKSPSYGNTIVKEGLPFNSFYLIKWIGIFQSEEEIAKSPKQPYNPKPGDLKYEDANGDGVIDAKDRVVVPGAYPKFYYGGSINLSWKNFDLTAFVQGVEGQKFYVQGGGWGLTPYVQGSPPTLDLIKNMWTPTNHTNKYPAMYMSGYGPVDGTASTYWLLNASYLRLKNLAIGYDLPKNFYGKIGLKGIRVYISGDNLITLTKYPGGDPERAGQAARFSSYPQLKIYTIGIKAKL